MRTPCLVLLLALSAFAQDYILHKSNTTEDLRGVSAPSHSVLWASGTHGIFLRTLDGGKSWDPAQVPGAESLDFRDVEAFSAEEAYLLAAGPGEQSRIYKTSDGGKSWILQFTNQEPKGFYDCMAFWDRDHGIALGDAIDGQFEIMETGDGGAHWNPIPEPLRPHSLAEEGAFAASGTCIAVAGSSIWFGTGGKVARVFRSHDRGKTWTASETPIVHANDSSGIFSIAFRDPSHGVIVGGDYKHPEQGESNIAFTSDGGITWKLSPLSPQSYFSAVASPAVPGRLKPGAASRRLPIIAVGSTRAAYAADVEQKAWLESCDLNLNAVAFDPSGTAVAVGPNGTIVQLPLTRITNSDDK